MENEDDIFRMRSNCGDWATEIPEIPKEREKRLVTKILGELYVVSKPLKGYFQDTPLKSVNRGFDVDGKRYNIKRLADFLTWNKGKDGENMRIICYDLNVFNDLRTYWGEKNKKRNKK
jgi:hypothetical protein